MLTIAADRARAFPWSTQAHFASHASKLGLPAEARTRSRASEGGAGGRLSFDRPPVVHRQGVWKGVVLSAGSEKNEVAVKRARQVPRPRPSAVRGKPSPFLDPLNGAANRCVAACRVCEGMLVYFPAS